MLYSLLVAAALTSVAQAGVQSIGVEGTLVCGDKPAAGVKVKLYEEGVFLDSNIGEVKTDAKGYFKIIGSKGEISGIDPKLNIYHHCGQSIAVCKRKWSYKLPSKYVFKQATPTKILNIGTLNLEVEPDEEDNDCVNRRDMREMVKFE